MLPADLVDDCITLITQAFREDIGAAELAEGTDCTTAALVPATAAAAAAFVSRAAGVVCGVSVCELIIQQVAPRLQLRIEVTDGQAVSPQQVIATLHGPAQDILTVERTCLNFLGRLSGISSLTHEYVRRVAGTRAEVLDTRKTTPAWRRLEKWAVTCGGGQNHRLGLYDAIMIKDNHLAFFRSQVADLEQVIPSAIESVRHWIRQNVNRLPHGEQTVVQLEVDTLQQLQIGLGADCDMILLDNMTPEQLVEAVRLRDQIAPQILLEASGGVNLETIASIAQTGVERISVGALTHSAVNFDIGLDWLETERESQD